MDLYMDEKWKLSKKLSRNSSSRRAAATEGSGGGSSGSSSFLRKSASTRDHVRGGAGGGGTPRSISGKCGNLVKEQRARFYIMRRCVTMLMCWRD